MRILALFVLFVAKFFLSYAFWIFKIYIGLLDLLNLLARTENCPRSGTSRDRPLKLLNKKVYSPPTFVPAWDKSGTKIGVVSAKTGGFGVFVY
jgi:hypothetical protein